MLSIVQTRDEMTGALEVQAPLDRLKDDSLTWEALVQEERERNEFLQKDVSRVGERLMVA
jgi:hypothetical protein